MVEMVSITTAGDTRAVPVFKVNDVTRQKYRWYYDLWKQGLQATPRGTPLESWPILTSDQVRSLKANNVFTVEHLAAMADANENRMPMIRTLKNQAKEWLAEKGKIQEKDAARAENDQLRGAISMLEQQIAELRANQVKGAAEPNHAIDAGRMNSDLEGMTAALSEATQSDDRKAEGPSDPDEFGATVPLESGEGLKPPYDQYGWGDLRAEYTRRFGKGPVPKMNTEAVVKALSDNDAA